MNRWDIFLTNPAVSYVLNEYVSHFCVFAPSNGPTDCVLLDPCHPFALRIFRDKWPGEEEGLGRQGPAPRKRRRTAPKPLAGYRLAGMCLLCWVIIHSFRYRMQTTGGGRRCARIVICFIVFLACFVVDRTDAEVSTHIFVIFQFFSKFFTMIHCWPRVHLVSLDGQPVRKMTSKNCRHLKIVFKSS